MAAEKRIGFVGVGNMGQCAHLLNYTDLEGCEVVAIAEIRPELAARVASRYEVPKVYADHRDMLAAESLDGIVAAQPFTRHGVLLPELYEAGVPVLTEKPLARSVQVGRRLLEAGGQHVLGYHKRSDPAVLHAVERIGQLRGSGELGALRYVRVLMPAGDWIANGFTHLVQSTESVPSLESDPPPEDMDEAMAGAYQAVVNYYIHQINLMRHLMGESYHVTFADRQGVLLATESESGVVGALEMSPYRTSIDWQEQVLVAFERGYLEIELPAPLASNRPGRVREYADAGDGRTPVASEPQLPWVGAMRQQATHFVQLLNGQTTCLCAAPEALEDLEVARDALLMKGQPS
ncbi:MAG: Gfo/Idh/MocA family oxidoreductase [Candidatus Latescibacteria bacterium]|jgi:predicted dehydrogenase|nr:dehydrogenase [Gemmatimonadaceae bacterium]MDP6017865.1 Gfo/Idh/MocA family oxidoreductase [Candidatus Latescibacterota bacterium]MDP7450211.1 Gfo/Idh/MocA family oxidoreductase [Candidatus Latescibacterota bacterium]HJP32513.1 Gfo/Idh/MocA family oxidoreductase [Candidatus Latescibacterota bacterium]|tara:strand:+ start:90 stop:1136 length:1047 start_codon:yes stop_codon:yes gene_type:complete